MALVSHMIPAEVRFHHENVDLIYSRYRSAATSRSTSRSSRSCGTETGYRTPWLAELPAID